MLARLSRTAMASLASLAASACQTADEPPSLVPVIASTPYTPPEKPARRSRVAKPVAPEPEPERPANAKPAMPPQPPVAQRLPREPEPSSSKDAPYRLPPFEVHERGFTDFGLSVMTNAGVARGKPIEWMRVGDVAQGSSAARNGLNTGDDILAIDDTLLSEVSREEMLRVFFQRERNDRLKLVIFGGRNLIPRIVILTAGKTPTTAR